MTPGSRVDTADAAGLDTLFRTAVAALDAGDVAALEQLLDAHPGLAAARLESPGAWLRDVVKGALDGFFQRPFLLWFVAEDPVRRGVLPANIAAVAQTLIDAARGTAPDTLPAQVQYALRLVAWSWIARQCGVQIALIDVLLDAGASPAGEPDNALVNGNLDAASYLVERGAPLTLSSALCLGRFEQAAALAPGATREQKQFALTMSALRGNPAAVSAAIGFGADLAAPSPDLYSHATALHHAVSAGSLDAVRVLVEAGAPLQVTDTAYGGTPLGWAEFGRHEEIAAYLRERGAR
jgi:hypothetical protein